MMYRLKTEGFCWTRRARRSPIATNQLRLRRLPFADISVEVVPVPYLVLYSSLMRCESEPFAHSKTCADHRRYGRRAQRN